MIKSASLELAIQSKLCYDYDIFYMGGGIISTFLQNIPEMLIIIYHPISLNHRCSCAHLGAPAILLVLNPTFPNKGANQPNH